MPPQSYTVSAMVDELTDLEYRFLTIASTIRVPTRTAIATVRAGDDGSGRWQGGRVGGVTGGSGSGSAGR